MLKCPNCDLLNPEDAVKCSCGFLFPPLPLYQKVVIKDIDMRFGSMVWFMVKWAFAAIPAMFIIALIGLIFMLCFGAIGILSKHIGNLP